MSSRPTPELLKYCAREISKYYQRLANAPPSGMKSGGIYISGIDPNEPKQVGLAKTLVQDVIDFNKRRSQNSRS